MLIYMKSAYILTLHPKKKSILRIIVYKYGLKEK